MSEPSLSPEKVRLARKEQRRKRRQRKRLLSLLFAALALGALLLVLLPQTWGKTQKEQDLADQGPECLRNVTLPDWVDVQIVPINGSGRRGVPLEDIQSIVVHYVGNPGTTAQQNRDYYAQETTSVSSHFVVGLEGEIIQCVPLNEKSSASNDRNRDTLSIETCHPDDTGVFTAETYASLVKLTAYLCDLCGFDSSRVIRHYDVTGKECPRWFVQDEAAWTGFLADVDAARTK